MERYAVFFPLNALKGSCNFCSSSLSILGNEYYYTGFMTPVAGLLEKGTNTYEVSKLGSTPAMIRIVFLLISFLHPPPLSLKIISITIRQVLKFE